MNTQVQDRLEESPGVSVNPVCQACDIADEIVHGFKSTPDQNAEELTKLLKKPHLKALLETHDAVAERRDAPLTPDQSFLTMPADDRADAVRVVGLRRNPDEPLVREARE